MCGDNNSLLDLWYFIFSFIGVLNFSYLVVIVIIRFVMVFVFINEDFV